MTTILVTHDQTEANALADRIAVMEDGALQQYGTPAELRDRPANLFVGTFIGEPPMNVIEAEARADGARVTFGLPGGLALDYTENEMAEPVRAAVVERHRVTLGVRPYAVRLGAEGLPARIVANQWLGDQTHVAAAFADQTVVAVEHERFPGAVGAEIRFGVAAADLHVFDTESGEAISHGGELV